MTAGDDARTQESWVPECALVAMWREEVLLEAGYPPALAATLSLSDCDLHRAVRMVEQGCNPELAAEILS